MNNAKFNLAFRLRYGGQELVEGVLGNKLGISLNILYFSWLERFIHTQTEHGLSIIIHTC